MDTTQYLLMDDPLKFYASMLEDIEAAKNYVFLEIYKFGNGQMGRRFRDLLTRKAREGVDVKILIDSWGSYVSHSFFQKLIDAGGEIRFFKKIKFFVDFFTKNHRRNHRKILVIDDKVSYIGSANIVEYSFDWRELVVRMEGDVALYFKRIFKQDFNLYNKYVFEKQYYTRLMRYGNMSILRDVPSITRQKIKKHYLFLIRKAQKEILIETPYFLPGHLLRKGLMEACRRGVDVKVIMPQHSDVRLVDILRNRYLGILGKNGVNFLFYTPGNLHAKLLIIDKNLVSLGSPNFDYRSFRYQHEIAIVTSDELLAASALKHIEETLKDCLPFELEKWKHRPHIEKFFEALLIPFRHLF